VPSGSSFLLRTNQSVRRRVSFLPASSVFSQKRWRRGFARGRWIERHTTPRLMHDMSLEIGLWFLFYLFIYLGEAKKKEW
jgi:hypothetical protein